MWNELLPRMIGGTITDLDSPTESSTVTGFRINPHEIEIHTAAGWTFGGQRRFFGISVDSANEKIIYVHSSFGLHAKVLLL